jgi:hypothetical protein
VCNAILIAYTAVAPCPHSYLVVIIDVMTVVALNSVIKTVGCFLSNHETPFWHLSRTRQIFGIGYGIVFAHYTSYALGFWYAL